MRTTIITITAAALIGLTVPASAQKLALPTGEWGNTSTGKPVCSPADISLTPNTIAYRLQSGQGRCKVTSLKKKGNTFTGVHACKWDASVPQGERENPDEDDDGSFNLIVKSPTRISLNNTDFGLCTSPARPAQ